MNANVPEQGTAAPPTKPKPSNTAYVGLGVAAAALGIATAVGVWLFNQAFGLVHRVVFDGIGRRTRAARSLDPDPDHRRGGHRRGSDRAIHAALEPLGALPHVIDGVIEHDGRLNGHNAAVAISGAAAGIGFGMPLGADTPSAIIGAHLASSVTTRLGWPTAFVQALVVAGVAAGISSTFLAQLAAVVFAFEVVLGGFGGVVFVVPTLIAVGVAGFVSYELVGTPATYAIPLPAIHWDATLLLYLAPAVLAGLAAIVYVTFLQHSKPLWARVALPPMGRMVIAGALVGLVAIWLPEVMGTGTATMKDLFGGATIPLATLLVLAVAETFLTPAALGAGFVGGVIGPSMLIGSTLGSALGDRGHRDLPGPRAVAGGVRDDRDCGDARRQLPRPDLRGTDGLRDDRQLRDARAPRDRGGHRLRVGAAIPGGLGLHDRPPRAEDLLRARDLPADGSISTAPACLRV